MNEKWTITKEYKKNFPNTRHTSSIMPTNNSFSAINFVLSIRIRGIIIIKLE